MAKKIWYRYIAVSRERRGSAMDEHGRPLPQPARDLRLLLVAVLHGNQGDDQPLPRDSRRGSARRRTRVQRLGHRV